MQKIISLFQRNYETDRLVRNELVPGAEWVLAGEGIATRKWDGACCMIEARRLYKRLELKAGKTPPYEFIAAQDADSKTGGIPGWMPVGTGAEDVWFCAAFRDSYHYKDGTYEAIGPHFGGGHHDKNPEACAIDILVPHGVPEIPNFPRTFEAIREYFLTMGRDFETGASIEGVVWHHPDGRRVKIKARDFGARRPMPLFAPRVLKSPV